MIYHSNDDDDESGRYTQEQVIRAVMAVPRNRLTSDPIAESLKLPIRY